MEGSEGATPLLTSGTFSKASLAPDGELDPETWPSYVKVVPIRAARVAGPFTVLVHDGEGAEISCQDGYLAVDARGYPYPIAVDEFELIYERNAGAPVLPANLPPTSLHEIALAHSYGIIDKDVAAGAAKRLLTMHGLLDASART